MGTPTTPSTLPSVSPDDARPRALLNIAEIITDRVNLVRRHDNNGQQRYSLPLRLYSTPRAIDSRLVYVFLPTMSSAHVNRRPFTLDST